MFGTVGSKTVTASTYPECRSRTGRAFAAAMRA